MGSTYLIQDFVWQLGIGIAPTPLSETGAGSRGVFATKRLEWMGVRK